MRHAAVSDRILTRVRRDISWPAVVVVAAAVAVVALSGYLLANWPPKPEASPLSSPPSATADTPSPAAAAGDKVVVLGDSVSAASTDSKGPEWPQLVGDALRWKVSTDAVDDSGYVSSGAGKPFTRRVSAVVDQSPDVVVVAGGIGDIGVHPTQQIVDAADQVIGRLKKELPKSTVVLISPFSNGEPGPLTTETSAGLEKVAQAHGVPYVDATRWLTPSRGLFGADGVHPTDQGQEKLAQQMEQALTQLGIADASPTAG
jgi:lysophospholipase L1-like esterase